MGLLKGKTEGGSGGNRGHSNMDHWATTAELKEASRKRRRVDSHDTIAAEVRAYEPSSDGSGRYRVRVYCEACWNSEAAACDVPHPGILPNDFASIREANDVGRAAVSGHEDWEWEVLDEDGRIVC